MTLLIIFSIPVGLLIDTSFHTWGEPIVSLWIWGLFLKVFFSSNSTDRISLLTCLAFGFLGEIFLCSIWGIYEYRSGTIPLFVYPGHCLLFYLGMKIYNHVPDNAVYFIPILVVPFVVLHAIHGTDTLSPFLLIVFLLLLKHGKGRKLYLTTFIVATILENFATRIGAWEWETSLPIIGLTGNSPPVLVGVFYCVLDWIVLAIRERSIYWKKRQFALDANRNNCQRFSFLNLLSREAPVDNSTED